MKTLITIFVILTAFSTAKAQVDGEVTLVAVTATGSYWIGGKRIGPNSVEQLVTDGIVLGNFPINTELLKDTYMRSFVLLPEPKDSARDHIRSSQLSLHGSVSITAKSLATRQPGDRIVMVTSSHEEDINTLIGRLKYALPEVKWFGDGPNSVAFRVPNNLYTPSLEKTLLSKIRELGMSLIGMGTLSQAAVPALIVDVEPQGAHWENGRKVPNTTEDWIQNATEENKIPSDVQILENTTRKSLLVIPNPKGQTLDLGYGFRTEFSSELPDIVLAHRLKDDLLIMVSYTQSTQIEALEDEIPDGVEKVGEGTRNAVFRIRTNSQVPVSDILKIFREKIQAHKLIEVASGTLGPVVIRSCAQLW